MNLKIIVHLCQRGALAGQKPVTDNQLNQNLDDPKNKEAFEEDAEMKAAVTDLDDSRAPTQMDFWADGEKKSNAEGSEISPEEEIKTPEGVVLWWSPSGPGCCMYGTSWTLSACLGTSPQSIKYD